MGAFDRIENAVQWARFRAMREEWERPGPLIDQARQQARRQVLQGEWIANDDKLLSLWGEHSRVIRRGKQGRPVEFGHKVTIWESQEGMLLCGGIYQQGNPAESPIVAAELEHMKSKGLRVESLTVDRGDWDPKTLAKIEAEGTRVYCPKKGKRSAERRGPEACPINSASTNYSTN